MDYKAFIFILLFLIPLVSADEGEDYSDISNTYESLNYFTDSALSNSELDTIDGCDIVSFKFNGSTNTLTFEIYNSNSNTVTLKVYDIYSKRNTELTLKPGKNYKEFYSVRLKGNQFCYVFWNSGGNMAIVKEYAYPLTLQDKMYLASSTALGFLSLQSGFIFAIIIISGQMVVSQILYKRMLIDYWKQGLLVLGISFIILIFTMLSMKYGVPIKFYDFLVIEKWGFVLKYPFFNFENWNFLYLVSYFNWIYPLALIIGFTLGFKLSKPEYLNFWYMDFKENMRDIKILPVKWERDTAIVRWDDGKIRKIKMPHVNATKFVNPFTGKLEDLYEITSYDLVDTPEKTYNETTAINRIITFFEKGIESLKDYLGRTKGTITIEFSKIMTKTVAESIFLHDNLESIAKSVNKWAKKFYDEKYQKSIKAQEFTAVAVEKIARDVNPLAKEDITDILGDIEDFFDMGIETYKKEDKKDDKDGSDSTGTENPR